MMANRLGFWSSSGLVTIGIGYVVALAAGFARHGLSEPIILEHHAAGMMGHVEVTR